MPDKIRDAQRKAADTKNDSRRNVESAIKAAYQQATFKRELSQLSFSTSAKVKDSKAEADRAWGRYDEAKLDIERSVAKAYDDFVSITMGMWIMIYHWSRAMALTHTRAFEINMEAAFGGLVANAGKAFSGAETKLSQLAIGMDFNQIKIDKDGVVNPNTLIPTINGLSIDDYFSKDTEIAPQVAELKKQYLSGFDLWLEVNGYQRNSSDNKIVRSDDNTRAITPDEFDALNSAQPLREFLSGRFGTPLQPESIPAPVIR